MTTKKSKKVKQPVPLTVQDESLAYRVVLRASKANVVSLLNSENVSMRVTKVERLKADDDEESGSRWVRNFGRGSNP
jgi:hypothetical protein